MNNLEQYLFDTLGIGVSVQGVDPKKLKNLPISLYLTFQEIKDERIEMEFERMVANLW